MYCGCVMGEIGKSIYTGREDELKMREIMTAHNADCAAYEKRIAELEAEVQRLYTGWDRSHKAEDEAEELRAERDRLLAATATLERLREVVSSESAEKPCKKLLTIQAILYPQPQPQEAGPGG